MGHLTAVTDRNAAIRAFVRSNFGLRGTLRLHRSAFGADLLRAPANVVLAPVFFFTRLLALLAGVLRCRRVSNWLLGRNILFETDMSRQVAARTIAFVADLEARGLGTFGPQNVVRRDVADYTGLRNAVGEITTTLIVVAAGYIVFRSATPGIISLAGPVAEMRAHSNAVAQFPFGQGLGRLYYGVFSSDPATWQLVATGLVLAFMASFVTTFSGVLIDPLQVIMGTHRRRLARLLHRLETKPRASTGLAREHITARLAELSDLALNAWRALRG